MASLKTPDGYEDFDPEWYLNEYYRTMQGAEEEGDLLSFFVNSLHDIFSSGGISGEKLLDIGTGPTVHSVISASRHVKEIHLSDFASQNRAVLQKWLDGAPNVPAVFEYIIKKENEGVSLDFRVQAVREKVKKIYPIDLLQPKPIEDQTCKYDVITESLCLEAVARSKEEYYSIVAKIADMTKPGGHVVLVGVLNENFYRVGDYKFYCLSIGSDDVKDAFEKAGFVIKVWKELPNKNYEPQIEKEYSDFEGLLAMVAQKKI